MCDIGQDKPNLSRLASFHAFDSTSVLPCVPLSYLPPASHVFLLPLAPAHAGHLLELSKECHFLLAHSRSKRHPLVGRGICSQPVHLLLTTRPSSASSASSGHSISSQWMELLGALDCRSCNSLRCCVTPRTILSEARRQTISRCVCAKAWCVQMWRARVR